MNVRQANIPNLSGHPDRDIIRLHEYAKRLEDTLSFILSNLNSSNFNLNRLPTLFEHSPIKFDNAEIHGFTNGIWIGTATKSEAEYSPTKGEYGLFIRFDAAPQKVVDGTMTDI